MSNSAEENYEEITSDSNATQFLHPNERVDPHNLFNLAARDSSLIDSRISTGSRTSSVPANNPDDRSGLKVLNCIDCTVVVGSPIESPAVHTRENGSTRGGIFEKKTTPPTKFTSYSSSQNHQNFLQNQV